jgi:hypothetical protein
VHDPEHHLVGDPAVASHARERVALGTEDELDHLPVGQRPILVSLVLDLAGTGRETGIPDVKTLWKTSCIRTA